MCVCVCVCVSYIYTYINTLIVFSYRFKFSVFQKSTNTSLPIYSNCKYLPTSNCVDEKYIPGKVLLRCFRSIITA